MSEACLTTLPNGLRIVTDRVAGAESAAIGIWAGVGTRDENLQHNGVAHMVEHMLFKGTPTRTAPQIAEQIESVGGHMNAYTGKETTAYYVHLLAEDLKLALEILADMYLNATLPNEEIERERQVILQEIGMAYDTPDDIIFDHYYETAYPAQGIGAPILGRAENISGMQRDTLAGYIRSFYTPARTVIAAGGNVDHDAIVHQVEKLFAFLPADTREARSVAAYKGGDIRVSKELEQAHLVLGFQGVDRYNDALYTAKSLSAVLGGGMSSRLFQEVREKRGLVYSIYSFHSSYVDDGQFAVYAGTGPEDLGKLVPVVCDELQKATQTITDEELARARAQMKSGLLIGRESMIARAEQQARSVMVHGEVFDPARVLQRLDAVTPARVQDLAARIFAGAPTVAALGPIAALEPHDAIVTRLRG